MIPVLILAAVVLLAFTVKPSTTSLGAGSQQAPPNPSQSPSIPYQTPVAKTASTPSSFPGAGVKPSGVIASNSQSTGVVNFTCLNTSEARGIAIDGTVLFDIQNVKDGPNSAIYLAGAILDHIDLMSFNGVVRLQVYYPNFSSPDQLSSSASGGLVEPEAAQTLGQTASTDSSMLAYPAGDPNYGLTPSSPNPAVSPDNSWYEPVL